ncbi:PNK3P-domain-containing protein [Durotheca rogersii]|uniref:PNK3P-domain-containing protein n=1 Tax=Durotheca rogersii TaxID=419775 RepID=UPI00222079B3|nr:PNK3P-domain-containing protein [Durotheca rogersii]KAI5860344.1 PNK3P-domain-containing protein [Durotheca rogersii]
MAPPSSEPSKRKATEKPVSPPPVKRKARSNISKENVAQFFTPVSEKQPDLVTWSERTPEGETRPTLLVGRYQPEDVGEADKKERRKIAAFDLDSTLITTESGNIFPKDDQDWQWWDASVPSRLRRLYRKEHYRIVIFSNQGGIVLRADPKVKGSEKKQERASAFKRKCTAVLKALDIPVSLYAAAEHDVFRKPRTGMWAEFCRDYGISADAIDRARSVFVGDAGGRGARPKSGDGTPAIRKDPSCVDRDFAHNLGLAYKEPEDYFHGDAPREFTRAFDLAAHPYTEPDAQAAGVAFEKTNEKDVVLFCGPPGAGKSTFYQRYLEPLGYERVNMDLLKTREKCFKAAAELLRDGSSVVVDSTNPDPEGRKKWIDLARDHGVPIRCLWFDVPKEVCQHNDAVRAFNKSLNPEARTVLPVVAWNTFFSRLRPPQAAAEGFQDVRRVPFAFRGSRDEYAVWARYWY